METRDGSETFLLETFLSLLLFRTMRTNDKGKCIKKTFHVADVSFFFFFFFPFLFFSPFLDGKTVVFRGHPRFLKNEARRSV